MSLSQPLVKHLVDSLARVLDAAAPGYCLRVDHLAKEDALAVCEALRASVDPTTVAALVLAPSGGDDPRVTRPERAVELRNRKSTKLCLFVPAGLVDAAASSLSNSFAVFDLEQHLRDVSQRLQQQLPEDLRVLVRQALTQLRGRADAPPERVADYVGAVLENPSAEQAGHALWRIGLIPDFGDGLVDRLADNRRCVQELVRPPRPQATAEERLDSTGIRRGAVRDELLAFLQGRRLRDATAWLPTLAEEPFARRISFERWPLESASDSGLESIELDPLLDAEGKVAKFTGLIQPSGPGTQPVAPVGPKAKIGVRWNSQPLNPPRVRRWRAEVIPSRHEQPDEDPIGVELPSTRVSAKTRRATIRLDVDLEAIPIRAVQVRVVALDEHDAELRGEDGQIVEGLSSEFWLSGDDTLPEQEPGQKRDTVPTIAYGRLRAAVEMPIERIDEAPGQWVERDYHYFVVTVNGRRSIRVPISPTLRAIERRIVAEHEFGGRYRADADVGEFLDVESNLKPLGVKELASTEAGTAFLARRREFLRLLERQGPRGLMEVAEWTPEMSRKARTYAAAFRDLLTACEPHARLEASQIDTIHLELRHTHGPEQAVLIAPTHPLRALWFAAYVDLVRHWETELLAMPVKERRRALDVDLFKRVAPLNCPAFVPSIDGTPFLFNQNVGFSWGLALPANARDPARQAAEAIRLLRFEEDGSERAGVSAERVADELRVYHEVHPYLESLRLNVVNPGSGAFLADVLRVFRSLDAVKDDEDEYASDRPPLRTELLLHTHEPLPTQLLPLTALQQEIYEAQSRGRRQHLSPLFSLALRPINRIAHLPGGDANLAVAIDQLAPSVGLSSESEHEDSSSFYGLLMRFLPTFVEIEDGAVWQHRISLPPRASRERHPAYGPYTMELVDTQREFLRFISSPLEGSTESSVPSVTVHVSPDDRIRIDALHRQSDWVISLDRFFGVEYFDDPRDAMLSVVARKYLLDYSPEFVEGLGRRMIVTTAHREEITEILGRAMGELGFGLIEESVGDVLDHLKAVSGRLALRIIGDDARAREAVSLGVVAAYLRMRGELTDSFLVPVDAHPELFSPHARQKQAGSARERCDLIRFRFQRNRLVATLIEVKSRGSSGASEELLHRIVDQIEATEEVLRDLFFRKDPVRLDHVLQRSRLATILRFYLRRAFRYGFVESQEKLRELEEAIGRLESGIPELRVERLGFVVSVSGQPQRPVTLRDVKISFLTAQDLATVGFSSAANGSSGPRGNGDAQSGLETPPPAPPSSPTAPREDRLPSKDVMATRAESSSAVEKQRPAGFSPSSAPGSSDYIAPTKSQTASPAHQPPDSGTDVRVELGSAVGDREVVWRPSLRGSPHLFILGIPGQGKSWTIARILRSLSEQAVGFLAVDFHGQFSSTPTLPNSSSRPLIIDAAEGLPFSPFEADRNQIAGASYWKTNCFAVAEIFQYVCELGDMQRDVVYEAIRDCYQHLGFEHGQPERPPTIDEVYSRIRELEQERGVRNVVARCRSLLEFGLFRDQESGGPLRDLQQLSHGGVVVDIHAVGLEELQKAAGAFLLRKVYKEMFRWGETTKLRFALVLDEAHRLAQDTTLPKIMKEGRKFGIAVLVASQGLADFHSDVLGNAGTKVVFRTNFPMSRKVAGFLRAGKGVDVATAIEQLEVGEAFVQTPEMSMSARVRMHPLHH